MRLRGVTETVVATLGPNDRWNQAALGVHADGPASTRDDDRLHAVTAFTYGNTRTRRNLHGRGEGVVQFTTDALDFANAALDVFETDAPVLESADAWVRVDATQVDARDEDGTRIETWRLDPVESTVRRRVVPVVNRGHAAVVDATVAASRLGVDGFDDDALRERLERAVDVVSTCGGDRERAAIRRCAALTADWSPTSDLPED
ncbi:DUF447 domain-containing protein [Halorubellus sp. PRR65]|uniref:DUF447 domain-containing protein n=1 Tax=Halorubellus sp. PRR65 TaxID=3098148 RepID=UPI002B263447|nr:DUF447 domain-containing protein [Halorubellus sp. PRR65]